MGYIFQYVIVLLETTERCDHFQLSNVNYLNGDEVYLVTYMG